MKKSLAVILFLGLWSFAAADGAALYKQCVQCHGDKGEKKALGGRSQVINTMSKDAVLASLKGYRDKSYGGAMKAVMEKQMAGFTDAQIDELTAYIMQIK